MKTLAPFKICVGILGVALFSAAPAKCAPSRGSDAPTLDRIRQEFEAYHQQSARAVDKKGRAMEKRTFQEWDKELRSMEKDLLTKVNESAPRGEEVRARMAMSGHSEKPAAAPEKNTPERKAARQDKEPVLPPPAAAQEAAASPSSDKSDSDKAFMMAGVQSGALAPQFYQEEGTRIAAPKDKGPAVEKKGQPAPKKRNIDLKKMAAATQIGITAGQLEAFDTRVTSLEQVTGRIEKTLESVQQDNRAMDKRITALESSRDKMDEQAIENSPVLKTRFQKIEGELARQAEVTASLNRSLEQMLEQQKSSEGHNSLGSLPAPAQDDSEVAKLKDSQERLQAETRKHAEALLALQKSNDALHAEIKSSNQHIEELLKKATRADSAGVEAAPPREMEVDAPATSEEMGNRARAAFQRFKNTAAPQSHDVEEFEDWEEFSFPAGAMTDDMPIAYVTARKASLMAVPGQEDTLIASVPHNSRLVVETRVGEWYRVIAPTGKRAWVHGDQIGFNGDYPAERGALKVGGYDARPGSGDDY